MVKISWELFVIGIPVLLLIIAWAIYEYLRSRKHD